MAHEDSEYVGIRVPGPVKRAWEEAAKRERRSLSNWILFKLEECKQPSSTRPVHERKAVNG